MDDQGYKIYLDDIFKNLPMDRQVVMFRAWVENFPDEAFQKLLGKMVQGFSASFDFYHGNEFSEQEIMNEWEKDNVYRPYTVRNLTNFGKYFYPTLRERLSNAVTFPNSSLQEFYREKVFPILLREKACVEEERRFQREVSEEIGKMKKFPKGIPELIGGYASFGKKNRKKSRK